MIAADPPRNPTLDRQADWELDFYSRPILEPDGKKRWELLISSTPELGGGEAFRYARRCPAGEVNSTWLTEALRDAMTSAEADGWRAPRRLRSWRSAMRTMVQRAAAALDLEMVPSRRTYALIDWMAERDREVYPQGRGLHGRPPRPTTRGREHPRHPTPRSGSR